MGAASGLVIASAAWGGEAPPGTRAMEKNLAWRRVTQCASTVGSSTWCVPSSVSSTESAARSSVKIEREARAHRLEDALSAQRRGIAHVGRAAFEAHHARAVGHDALALLEAVGSLEMGPDRDTHPGPFW
jgi:hypothetical protein